MNPPVPLCWARSGAGQITFASDRLAATGWQASDGSIHVSIERFPDTPAVRQARAFVDRHRKGWMPRTLLFALENGAELSPKQRLGTVAAGLLLFVALPLAAERIFPANPSQTTHPWLALAIGSAGFAGAGWCIRQGIGSWHAAEHMAARAYETEGSTDLAAIRRQSRIHPGCGTALVAPLFAMMAACVAILALSGAKTLAPLGIGFLVTAEIFLRIDAAWGWDRLPVSQQLSAFLQEHVTTRRPDEQELKTAQAALRGLLRAHGSASPS